MKFNVHPKSLVLGGAGGCAVGALLGYLLGRRVAQAGADAEVAAVKQQYEERLGKSLSAIERRNAKRPKAEASVGTPELGDDCGTALEGDEADAAAGRINALVDRIDAARDPRPTPGSGSSWAGVIKGTVGTAPAEDPGDDSPVSAASGHAPRTNYSAAHRVIDDKPDLASLAAGVRQETRPEPRVSPVHVISTAEFMEDKEEYDKLTITWWEGDEVLTDDKEAPIPRISETIGDAVDHFGDQSEDENIVYVRNNKLQVDFEVTLDHRKYSEVVLGYGNPAKVAERKAQKA